MKIGILTFHTADNYGAALQAFALASFLVKSTGQLDSVEFVDYSPGYITRLYRPFFFRKTDSLASSMRSFLGAVVAFRSRWRRYRRFRVFYRLTMPSSRMDKGRETRKFDLVICGSDQIWNPRITQGFDPVFFGHLSSAFEIRRIISYAASFGVQEISQDESIELAQLLPKLDSISVRESSGLEIISKLPKKFEAKRVLDPVFLLTRADWEKLAQSREPKRRVPYILVYRMDGSEQIRRLAEEFATQKGYSIVELSYYRQSQPVVSRVPYSIENQCGPIEFLSLVAGASHVFTNSFHGVAFSIVLERPFLAFEVKSGSARIKDLLGLLGLADFFVGKDLSDQGFGALLETIDFSSAHRRLEEETSLSKAFLLNELANTREK